MIIMVDAYNILKQVRQTEINHYERTHFIGLLKKYARRKKHHVVIVFDGGGSTWPSKEVLGVVTVVYSGSQLSADDYILRTMKEFTHKEFLLVTDDQELREIASRLGIDLVRSLDFYRMIQPEPKKRIQNDQVSLIKLAENTLDEVDVLMQEYTSTMPVKEDQKEPVRERRSFTPSKKERKIIKKIKKL